MSDNLHNWSNFFLLEEIMIRTFTDKLTFLALADVNKHWNRVWKRIVSKRPVKIMREEENSICVRLAFQERACFRQYYLDNYPSLTGPLINLAIDQDCSFLLDDVKGDWLQILFYTCPTAPINELLQKAAVNNSVNCFEWLLSRLEYLEVIDKTFALELLEQLAAKGHYLMFSLYLAFLQVHGAHDYELVENSENFEFYDDGEFYHLDVSAERTIFVFDEDFSWNMIEKIAVKNGNFSLVASLLDNEHQFNDRILETAFKCRDIRMVQIFYKHGYKAHRLNVLVDNFSKHQNLDHLHWLENFYPLTEIKKCLLKNGIVNDSFLNKRLANHFRKKYEVSVFSD